MKIATAALALSTLAGGASALDLYLIQTEDISSLSATVLPAGNAFWIGQTPTSIAFDGENLYVGGILNGPDPVKQSLDPVTGEPLFSGTDPVTGEPIPVTEYLGWASSVVKIENFLAGPGNRAFRAMPDSQNQATLSRGIQGLDFVAGAGLVTSYDSGSLGTAGSHQYYDVESQLNPILVAQTASGDAPRGISGPSWDFGANGTGIDYERNDDQAAGFGVADGPLVAMLDFNIDPNGPLGVLPSTMDTAFGQTIYEPTATAGGPIIGQTVGKCGTIWRDIDIDPNTGLIAARGNNEVLLATRSADVFADQITLAIPTIPGPVIAGPYDCAQSPSDANPQQIAWGPFILGQNVNIMHGATGGDRVIFNSRSVAQGGTQAGQSFAETIRMIDLAGSEIAINWLDSDGNALSISTTSAEDGTTSIPTGTSAYDFAWHEPTQTLLICDAFNRLVYVFSTEAPAAPCVADVTTTNTNPGDAGYGLPDGAVDGADLSYFVEQWLGSVIAIADVTTTNTNPGDADYGVPDGQVDGADLSYFVEQWLGACL